MVEKATFLNVVIRRTAEKLLIFQIWLMEFQNQKAGFRKYW